MRQLEQYPWPGNVRELENIIQRALVVAKGEAILPADLPPEITRAVAAPKTEAAPAPIGPVATAPTAALPSANPADDIQPLVRALFLWARAHPNCKLIPAVERELIINALREHRGNQVHAARMLGITRATLRKRVEKFGIKQELQVK